MVQPSDEKKGREDRPVEQKKVKGWVQNGEYYVEAILIDDIPHFLRSHKATGKLDYVLFINTGTYLIRPPEKNQLGHIPYTFTRIEVEEIMSLDVKSVSKEHLLDKILEQIDKFIVAPEIVKYLILGDILVTYCLEWINILHYLFFIGDTESGKSSALHLARWLCYRCHFGEDIPMADIYNYLGTDEEGCGTIAEDEAQGLGDDSEKLRMYKGSYAKGSTKARIVGYQSLKKHQVYYNTFCPIWFAGEWLPNNKGFLERIVKVFMLSGNPKSNIKDPPDEDKKQLLKLRNQLLIWKICNIANGLEPTITELTRRNKELWEGFLRTVQGTKYYDKCMKVVEYYVNQREASMRDSLEATVLVLVISTLNGTNEINIREFWQTKIVNNPDFPGRLDTLGKVFYSDDFGKISMNFLSKILLEKFQAEKISHYKNGAKTTYYVFNPEKLELLVQKYKIENP